MGSLLPNIFSQIYLCFCFCFFSHSDKLLTNAQEKLRWKHIGYSIDHELSLLNMMEKTGKCILTTSMFLVTLPIRNPEQNSLP